MSCSQGDRDTTATLALERRDRATVGFRVKNLQVDSVECWLNVAATRAH